MHLSVCRNINGLLCNAKLTACNLDGRNGIINMSDMHKNHRDVIQRDEECTSLNERDIPYPISSSKNDNLYQFILCLTIQKTLLRQKWQGSYFKMIHAAPYQNSAQDQRKHVFTYKDILQVFPGEEWSHNGT